MILVKEGIHFIHLLGGKQHDGFGDDDGKAALRLAKEESGLTRDEIAERLGVSHSVTKRYFNINDTYMPRLGNDSSIVLGFG